MTQTPVMNEKQVAQRCSECGKMEVYPAAIHYDARVKHDNCLYTFSIPDLHVLQCRSCGDILFDDVTDDQISQALREHLGLLSPQEIRTRIGRLGLTQKGFSEQISICRKRSRAGARCIHSVPGVRQTNAPFLSAKRRKRPLLRRLGVVAQDTVAAPPPAVPREAD